MRAHGMKPLAEPTDKETSTFAVELDSISSGGAKMKLRKLMLVGLSVFVIVAMLAGCVATPPPAGGEPAAAPAEERSRTRRG